MKLRILLTLKNQKVSSQRYLLVVSSPQAVPKGRRNVVEKPLTLKKVKKRFLGVAYPSSHRRRRTPNRGRKDHPPTTGGRFHPDGWGREPCQHKEVGEREREEEEVGSQPNSLTIIKTC